MSATTLHLIPFDVGGPVPPLARVNSRYGGLTGSACAAVSGQILDDARLAQTLPSDLPLSPFTRFLFHPDFRGVPVSQTDETTKGNRANGKVTRIHGNQEGAENV